MALDLNGMRRRLRAEECSMCPTRAEVEESVFVDYARRRELALGRLLKPVECERFAWDLIGEFLDFGRLEKGDVWWTAAERVDEADEDFNRDARARFLEAARAGGFWGDVLQAAAHCGRGREDGSSPLHILRACVAAWEGGRRPPRAAARRGAAAEKPGRPKDGRGGKFKPVRNVATGEVFSSAAAAADSVKRSPSSVANACRKKGKCAGVRWEYVD